MAQFNFTDSETLDLSVDDGGNFTGEIKPLGTACALVDDAEALAKLTAAINTDTDTFAEAEEATEAGTDSFGNAIAVGDPVLTLPGGDTICVAKVTDTDTDTFGTPSLAAGAGTDAYGNAYAAGASIVTFPNGDVVCVATNPIVSRTCDDFKDIVTDKAGVQTHFAGMMSTQRALFNFANNTASIFNAATPDGELLPAGSAVIENCGPCPVRIWLDVTYHSNTRITNGAINHGIRVSLNGANPQTATAGFSSASLGGQSNLNDQTNSGIWCGWAPVGTSTVEIFVHKNFNSGTPEGEVRFNQVWSDIYYPSGTCCGPAPEGE